MHGLNGFWKWLATPRSATLGTTRAWLESNVEEARFGEQLRWLHQSIEDENERARLESRWGRPRHQLARAAGSGIVRSV
jgi:hypothetical protein